MMKFITAKELMEQEDIRSKEMSKIFKYDKKYNVLDIKAYGLSKQGYPLDLCKIKTKSHLLEWVHHLCEKNWMNTEMFNEIIERVCRIKKWKIYGDI